MKKTFKDVAHYYLGTELKIDLERLIHPRRVELTVLSENNLNDIKYFVKIHRAKPYLRPLSSLTKLITVEGYNNGKPFVPFEHIAKIEAPLIEGSIDKIKNIVSFNRGISFSSRQIGVVYQYENVTIEITHYKGAIFHKKAVNGNDSWIFSYFHNYPKILEMLYKWHFNVFGLDESQYIEIKD